MPEFEQNTPNQISDKFLSPVIIILAIIYTLIAAYILCCYPKQIIPDDLYIHMSVIQQYIIHGKPYIFGPQEFFIRPRWHLVWSWIFKLFNVHDVLLYPVIIFRTQGIITFACLSYMGGKFYSLLTKRKNLAHSMIVGLCASLLFFLGTGVSSQSWFIRYGTTYQITLPLSFVVDTIIMG